MRHRLILAALSIVVVLTTGGRTRAESLLVSGFGSSNVVAFDASTGLYQGEFISAGSGGLRNAEGLVIAPDGSLLVASYGSGQILRYDGHTGAFIGVFASFSGPTGLVVHNGIVFASSYSTGKIEQFDPATGTDLGTFATASNAHGMVFGPDGNLYVHTHYSGGAAEIVKFDGTNGTFDRIFASGNGLTYSSGVTFGPNGNLYAASYQTFPNNLVLQFNGNTGSFVDKFVNDSFPPATPIGDPVQLAHGLIFRGDGYFYAAGGGEVRRYNESTGAFVDSFASSANLNYPTYMVFAQTTAAVPEPSSIAFAGLGGLVLVFGAYRRRRVVAA